MYIDLGLAPEGRQILAHGASRGKVKQSKQAP
jgi:hypothetical protein